MASVIGYQWNGLTAGDSRAFVFERAGKKKKKEVGRCPVQFNVLVLDRVGMRMAPGDGGCQQGESVTLAQPAC